MAARKRANAQRRASASGAVTPAVADVALPSEDHVELLLDEALLETFPASDPPAPAIDAVPEPSVGEASSEIPADADREGAAQVTAAKPRSLTARAR